jgi:hypothetical protein
MELTFNNSTVMTRLPVNSIILRFLTVADSLTLYASDQNRELQLCRLNLLAHGVRSGLTKKAEPCRRNWQPRMRN